MAVSRENVKAKADTFASKLAEYVDKHTQRLRTDKKITELQRSNEKVKNHRILLSKSETSEIIRLIREEQRNLKIQTIKEIIKRTSSGEAANTQVESLSERKRKLEIFNLSDSMVETLTSPPRQAVEVKGASNHHKEIKQDFVKMKASGFISRLSDTIFGSETENKKKTLKPSDSDTSKVNTINSLPPGNKLIKTLNTENNKEKKLTLKNVVSNIINKLGDDINEKELEKFNQKVNSVVWGIKIGISNKIEVLEILKKYSRLKAENIKNKGFIICPDISFTVYFNDNEIVRQIEINDSFMGSTKEGIKIGDHFEKALNAYGNLESNDEKSLTWPGFKVFHHSGKIFSMIISDNTVSLEFDKNKLTSDFIVYTHGMLLGIILTTTKSVIINGNNKKYVINFMKDYSNIKFNINTLEYILDYEDVSIEFYFNSSDNLDSIRFYEGFKGQTLKGLKIGDHITKAIELYDEPLFKEESIYIWNKMKLICEDNTIKSIKIQK